MVRTTDSISVLAHAIADRTRRELFHSAAQGERRVLELAAEHPRLTLAAVSKHLQVLERAGLVKKRREGRDVYCRANPQPLRKLESFVQRYSSFWNARLDELERHLKSTARSSERS